MKRAKNLRRGLRPLTCDRCDARAYQTWTQAERARPLCSCGGEYLPDDLELAMHLGLEHAPVVREYARQLASVQHGQAWTGNYGAQPAEQLAAARVAAERAAIAHRARLDALRPAAEPIPF
jgi:hypothetical protein